MTRASLAILCGGESTRMGHDKATVLVAGRPLASHTAARIAPLFGEILLSVNDRERARELRRGLEKTLPRRLLRRTRVVRDAFPGKGPLCGMAASLAAARNPVVLFAGCDMPFVTASLARRLIGEAKAGRAAFFRTARGREPLLCALPKSGSVAIAKAIRRGEFAVHRALAAVGARAAALGAREAPSLRNLNTPQDLAAAEPELLAVSRKRTGR